MLKNKYQRMNKKEKHELLNEFKKTKDGKDKLARLNRIFIYGALAFLYSIYILIDNRLNSNSVFMYIFGVIVCVTSLVFIFAHFKLKSTTLNKYAIKGKKK